MIICPKCGHSNRPGTFSCDKCSWLLQDEHETVHIPEEEQQKMVFAYQVHRSTYSFDQYHVLPPQALALHIQDVQQPIILVPRERPYLIGRGAEQESYCDVDFASYQGDQKGVSRRHAIIYFENDSWRIEDLGSTNGTRINDFKVTPKVSYRVEHGDVLQFGLSIAQVAVTKSVTTSSLGKV